MAWVMMLLALACFVLAFFSTSVALGACCLLLTLILMVISTMMLLSARVGDVAPVRHDPHGV